MVVYAEKSQSDWNNLAGGKRYSYAERAASIFWLSVNFDDGSCTLKQLTKEIIRATDGACEALKTLITTEEIQHLATRDYFSALILSRAPTGFVRCIETVLTTSLMRAHGSFFKCDNAEAVKSINQFLAFSSFWTNVHFLGWYHFFRETIHKVFYEGIDRCVFDICAERYDTPMLHILERWKKSTVLPWLIAIDRNSLSSKFERHTEAALGRLVDLVVVETYVSARVKQFYDIITEFPESACAVVELCNALSRTRQHHFLARSLRLTLCRRLLHLGANTSQIIEMYISTIKVLRILDPRRILLDTVTMPVRQYLQHRKDTVRCIVANLTDELSGELYEELHRSKSMVLGSCDSDNENHDSPGEDWVPNPSNCQNAIPKTMRDILSMLISIYGTREIFVDEYRQMLADK